MSLSLHPVTTKNDRKRFIRLLWDIYKNDPLWVPPMEMDRMKLIDTKKNPFYQHADLAMWIAREGGRDVGRVAAIINHSHNEFHNERTGFFGFFESINNQDVANMLLDQASKWCEARGMTAVRGPVSPSTNDECGLLVEGFNSSPMVLMTYNPSYYLGLIERAGFGKCKDLLAWQLTTEKVTTPKLERVARLVKEREGVTLRTLNMKDFNAEVKRIRDIYNNAWSKNWGFVPMTDAEFDFLAADLKQIVDPNLLFFAEVGGKPVGFGLGLPDVNQAFHGWGKKIPRGIMNLPIALYKLFTGKKHINQIRIITLGIIHAYQRRGIDALLYLEYFNKASLHGWVGGEASWVLEDNEMMNRSAKLMNGECYKRYRIYEKKL